MERVADKIRWFNEKKGYGFSESESCFLHISNFEEIPEGKIPRTGDRISFFIVEDEKGRKAKEIMFLSVY